MLIVCFVPVFVWSPHAGNIARVKTFTFLECGARFVTHAEMAESGSEDQVVLRYSWISFNRFAKPIRRNFVSTCGEMCATQESKINVISLIMGIETKRFLYRRDGVVGIPQ